MRWASSLATRTSAAAAMAAAAEDVGAELGSDHPDLVLFFASHHYSKDYARLSALLASHLPGGLVAGCSALGVVAGGRETEQEPAIGIVAGLLPGVACHGVHLLGPELPDPDEGPDRWAACLGLERSSDAQFLVLADPFCPSTGALLDGLDFTYPNGTKLGALASGAGRPGANALWLDRCCHRDGMIVIALRGNLAIDPLVFQSCRPIGVPATVTCSNRELLLGLNGVTPLEFLRELIPSLNETDRALAEHALFVGIFSETPPGSRVAPGHLMRTVLGIDWTTGALALAERVDEGTVIQFHVRDRQAAVAELDRVLDGYLRRGGTLSGEEGLLLFPCLGRGRHLFGETGFETGRVGRHLGPVPVGGFFCNGEIGPSGPGTSLLSYSSVLGVVRPARRCDLQRGGR